MSTYLVRSICCFQLFRIKTSLLDLWPRSVLTQRLILLVTFTRYFPFKCVIFELKIRNWVKPNVKIFVLDLSIHFEINERCRKCDEIINTKVQPFNEISYHICTPQKGRVNDVHLFTPTAISITLAFG